ncbi:MAG: M20/M25/M40 family metallo-hydrolase [Chloroflexi bacterium]|nr:M20/M25/M40 family metallo-hydrolase [Chloroflexota bacterium]
MSPPDIADIDWDAVTEEATDILSRYIQIDTTNPPGNEAPAVRFLEEILRKNGIDDITFYDASDDKSQGRLNMLARLPGDGSAKPFVLLNHTDVVPVERDGWDEEPFAGLVKDGVIWGRGAVDMKGMGVMELIAMLLLKRQGIPLKRDIVFLAVADEEAGSDYGAEFLAREHPETLDAEYVLNEGGWGATEMMGTDRPAFNCAVSEKGPCWLKLTTAGRPGHGSVPHGDSALDRLLRALHRVQEWQRPRTVVPELAEFFAQAHAGGYIEDEPTEESIIALGERNPLFAALTSNTISVTTINSGVKHNVIPATAEATLDCRLLPGTDAEEFIEELRGVIDDPEVGIERVLVSSTPPSPLDTGLMAVIKDVVREHVEEAAVLPSVSSGFTDSRVFRNRGVTAYGFIPALMTPSESISIHGHNERLSIDNLRLGCQILYEILRRTCA